MLLPPREAYRRWAPKYEEETVVSLLDEMAAVDLTPPLADRALLDVGCGTARRLAPAERTGPRIAVGVDLVPEMLRSGERAREAPLRLTCADLRALPLPPEAFDVIWCRLVLGHLPELPQAYAELSRVARAGGTVLVTDFHPAAAAAGHVRAFRDGDVRVEIEHHVHAVGDHMAAAAAHGLRLAHRRDMVVGPEVRHLYERAAMGDRFALHLGLPLVLALVFRR